MSTNSEHADFNSKVFSKIGEELYLKIEKADVFFVFESCKDRVPAHKILLSSASDVFDTMFYGSLKEDGDIRIVDATAEIFKEFLQFFYFNTVELDSENIVEITYLAKKYNVPECLRVCADLLATKLTVENVLSIYSLAIVYDESRLKELCEEKIRAYPKEILKTSGFLKCDRQILNHILNINYLSCSDSLVFEACMSWIRARSKQEELTRDIVQTHLGDSFYELRFGSMSLDEFLKLLPSYGHLFSGDEYNEILQIISQQKIEPKKFKNPNMSWDGKILECDRTVSCLIEEKYIIRECDTTTFSSNRPLLLSYFLCSPIFNCIDESRVKHLPVFARIISDSTHVEAELSDCAFSVDGCVVRSPKPILIKPRLKYDIQLFFAKDQFFALREVETDIKLTDTITVQFHNDPVQNFKVRGIVYKFGFILVE